MWCFADLRPDDVGLSAKDLDEFTSHLDKEKGFRDKNKARLAKNGFFAIFIGLEGRKVTLNSFSEIRKTFVTFESIKKTEKKKWLMKQLFMV